MIEKFENREVELMDVDPDYYQEEYVDGLGDLLIVHKLDEETEVFFEEHDYVKEERKKFYNGEITDVEFNDFIANLNDLEGQFDYNKVAAYRVYGKPMEFVSDFKKENEVELDM